MLIHPGYHIGDSWYTIADDTIHCYYLTCPDSIERHTAWDIGHATSRNLVDWDIQPLALRKGPPGTSQTTGWRPGKAIVSPRGSAREETPRSAM